MSATTHVHEVVLPPRLNPATVAALLGAVRCPERTDVVVVRGEAGFCDGLDLAAARGGGEQALRTAVFGFARVLTGLATCPHPLLAVVEGAARGGGVGLASVCDVVLAGPEASFGLPEAVFGLTPAVIGPAVAARVGAAALRRLTLTARTVGAREALTLGLVDVVHDDVVAKTAALVRALRRTKAAALPLRARFGPQPAAFVAGAEETLGRLHSGSVQRRLAAFADGGCPWEVSP